MRMGWLLGRNNARIPFLAALLVLIGALVVRAADPVGLSRLRDVAFDVYQRLKPRPYNPATPVRIVDIDEASLAEYGQWPWPRTVIARLVDKLTEKGVATIAFDVVFAEPDRSSMSRMVRDLVAYLSAAVTLLPGDVILTGTPAGIGPIVPGDRMEIELEGGEGGLQVR